MSNLDRVEYSRLPIEARQEIDAVRKGLEKVTRRAEIAERQVRDLEHQNTVLRARLAEKESR